MKQFLKIPAAEPGTAGEILRTAGLTARQISRAKFQEDGICKNGRRCRVTEQVRPGDVLRVCLEAEKKSSGHLEAPPGGIPALEILYEDENVLAVNKPAGLVTHPQGRHFRDSLANQAVWYFREKGLDICVHAVGRLDRETSGIVLFGKSQAAAAALQRQREQNILKKTYLAAVRGSLPRDNPGQWHTIEIPLAADPENPLRQKAVLPQDPQKQNAELTQDPQKQNAELTQDPPKQNAELTQDPPKQNAVLPQSPPPRRAVTHYQTLYSSPGWSLLKLQLDTGRTHQIRVHMAAVGHPLLGDRLYGGNPVFDSGSRRKCGGTGTAGFGKQTMSGGSGELPGSIGEALVPEFSRTALHAWKAEFLLPFGKKKISVEAPLPEDFESLVENL